MASTDDLPPGEFVDDLNVFLYVIDLDGLSGVEDREG